MNNAFLHQMLPLAFGICLFATIILLFARRTTRNVSPAPGSTRWLIQIFFLFLLIVVWVVLSHFVPHQHLN